MNKLIRIGTRESKLAVWQANQVKELLHDRGHEASLEFIKSEGDIDLQTPLYEMGVQGIFTRSLDIALLDNRIDIAVHSMKDVPTQLPQGIIQAAVLTRGSHKDLLVYNGEWSVVSGELGVVNVQWPMTNESSAIGSLPAEQVLDKAEHSPLTTDHSPFTIATSSIRRKAQWLHRYPHHSIEGLRGNVNTRLHKLKESSWNGAIFAAAGLERINLRPPNAIELSWMLPAPAQGAIMIACREGDQFIREICGLLNDKDTEICTHIERDFLRTLLGGCSTPISALAEIIDGQIHFRGNILSHDGSKIMETDKWVSIREARYTGKEAATELLFNGGQCIADSVREQNNKA